MLLSVDSRYQNIVVAGNDGQYSLFGNGQYLTSFPDPYETALFTHFTLSQHPFPRTILLVGGGITGILHEILKYPVELIHHVELDPGVRPQAELQAHCGVHGGDVDGVRSSSRGQGRPRARRLCDGIASEVIVPGPCRRPKMNGSGGIVIKKLNIIHKTKESGPKLGMNIRI